MDIWHGIFEYLGMKSVDIWEEIRRIWGFESFDNLFTLLNFYNSKKNWGGGEYIVVAI